MWLSWLDLEDWRNHPSLTWAPDPGVNVLVGPNGAGKTSILEAIAYLSSPRSFRGSPDEGLIAAGAEQAVIRGGFEKPAGESRVEIEVPRQGRRRILVNGKRPARLSAVANQFPVVAFLPDDLELVKGSASGRRLFLDDLGSRLSPGYGATLSEYENVLRQRNALLRQDGPAIDPVSLERLGRAAGGDGDDGVGGAGRAGRGDRPGAGRRPRHGVRWGDPARNRPRPGMGRAPCGGGCHVVRSRCGEHGGSPTSWLPAAAGRWSSGPRPSVPTATRSISTWTAVPPAPRRARGSSGPWRWGCGSPPTGCSPTGTPSHPSCCSTTSSPSSTMPGRRRSPSCCPGGRFLSQPPVMMRFPAPPSAGRSQEGPSFLLRGLLRVSPPPRGVSPPPRAEEGLRARAEGRHGKRGGGKGGNGDRPDEGKAEQR